MDLNAFNTLRAVGIGNFSRVALPEQLFVRTFHSGVKVIFLS